MKLTRCMDGLETAIRWTVVILLLVMVGAIGSQVVARYVFNQALYWTEELGRHVMIWMVFLASVLCLRRGYHLSITLLTQRLGPRVQAALQIVATLAMGVFFALMVLKGWTLAQKTLVQRASALHYPMGWVYASLPASGFLMFLVNLELLAKACAVLLRRDRAGRD